MQEILQLRQQRSQAAGVVEILHQVAVPGRSHIGEERHLRGKVVEALERELDAGATRHRDQMDDGIGGATHRKERHQRIVERLRIQDIARLEVFPHHVDDALAGERRHLGVVGVRRRNGGRAGQG